MRKPLQRLLFLCQTLPFPPDGGVNIRAYHLLRLLAEEYEVTALCFFRRSTRPDDRRVRDGVAALRSFADVEAFPIPQEQDSVRFAWDHLRSLLSGRVYTRFAYEAQEFRARLEQVVSEQQIAVVHMDSLDLSGYLEVLPPVPLVIDHHNVESALLRRRASKEPTFLRRWYLLHQAKLMEREERRWCPVAQLNLTVSTQDRDELVRIAPNAPISVVPNGVDTASFQAHDGECRGAIFVGGHTWFPNRDGMEFFAQSILPLLRNQGTDVTVRWIGRAPQDVIDRYDTEFGIEMTGYVDDIRPYVEEAACFIVPLRVGGGTRLKILDAWAMGKAVVSTSLGAEGLAARDGHNILIRDTPEAFAEAVRLVMSDPALRSAIGRGGRRTAEEVYDWSVIGGPMLDSYRRLVS